VFKEDLKLVKDKRSKMAFWMWVDDGRKQWDDCMRYVFYLFAFQ
jgi:hypothetical protein